MTLLAGKIYESNPKTQTELVGSDSLYYIVYRERLHFLQDGKVELSRILIEDQWSTNYRLERHRFQGRYHVPDQAGVIIEIELKHIFLPVSLDLKALPAGKRRLVCHGTFRAESGEEEQFDEIFLERSN